MKLEIKLKNVLFYDERDICVVQSYDEQSAKVSYHLVYMINNIRWCKPMLLIIKAFKIYNC